jgi:hypothetical protein
VQEYTVAAHEEFKAPFTARYALPAVSLRSSALTHFMHRMGPVLSSVSPPGGFMRKTVGISVGIVAAVALGFFAMSCGSSTDVKTKTYVANLSPANEVPPKTGLTSSGVATFEDEGTDILWTLNLTNMTGVTASHIHLGAVGTAPAANIIFNLFIPNGTTGPVSGIVAQGTITSANNVNVSLDSLRKLFNNGNAYVNVHTTANPGGEIRDQVHPQ